MQFTPLDREGSPHKTVSKESVTARKLRNPAGDDFIDRLDLLIDSLEREIKLMSDRPHVLCSALNGYHAMWRDMLMAARAKYALTQSPSILSQLKLPQPEAIDMFHLTKKDTLAWPVVDDSQSQVDSSWRRLAEELDEARRTSNSLTRMAAKKKTLLLDNAIPLPTIYTIQAWMGICLTGRSSDRLWFITPHLPCTAEHRGRGGVAAAQDTHANHSLSIKSKEHARDEDGKLLHGIALCFESTKAGVTGMQQLTDSSNTVGSLNFWKFKLAIDSKYLTAPLPDPYGDTASRSTWLWQADSQRQIDNGLRALAKWYNVYLRFDNELASRRWAKAFRDSYFAYAAMSPCERQKVQFDWALQLTQKPLRKAIGKGGKKVLMDMPEL